MTAVAVLIVCGAICIACAAKIDRAWLVADFFFVTGVFAVWLGILALGFEVVG